MIYSLYAVSQLCNHEYFDIGSKCESHISSAIQTLFIIGCPLVHIFFRSETIQHIHIEFYLILEFKGESE